MALEVFKLFGSIMVNNDQANKNISKTEEKAGGLAKKFVSGVGTAAKWGAAVAGAAAAGGAALFGMANKAAGTTDRIDKLSQKIGISRQGFQEWEFILSQSGMDIEKMQTGLKTLNTRMAEAQKGTGAGAEAFNRLKISALDSKGALKSQEQMFEETVTALQKMEDGTEKSRLATQLFGKAGLELMPLLNGAAGSVEELKAKAHELGLVISDESVDAGVKFTDTIDQLKRSFSAVVTNIGVSVMPIIQQFCDFILANMPVIQAVLGGFFSGVEFLVSTVVGTVTTLFGNFNLSWDSVMQFLNNTWQSIGLPLFTGIAPLIQSVSDNWKVIWDAIKMHFETIWMMIKGIWDSIGKPVFDLMVTVIGTVANFFAERMPAISGFFSQMVNDIRSFWVNNLQPCLQAIGDFINNKLAPAFRFVFNNVIGPVVDACFRLIKNIWNGTLKPVLTGITQFLEGVFTGSWRKVFQGLGNIVSGVFNGLVSVVKAPINAIIGMVNKAIGGLNKLKIPDWVPGVGGKGINIPKIPMLAKGTDYFSGSAYGNMAIVGEKGPELVNLPTGSKVKTASETKGMINDKPLVLQCVLDGNVIAETIANYTDIVNGGRMNLTERGLVL